VTGVVVGAGDGETRGDGQIGRGGGHDHHEQFVVSVRFSCCRLENAETTIGSRAAARCRRRLPRSARTTTAAVVVLPPPT
jgi:hypothetical protein